MRRALLGSLALHAAIGAALWAGWRPAEREPVERGEVRIEVIDARRDKPVATMDRAVRPVRAERATGNRQRAGRSAGARRLARGRASRTASVAGVLGDLAGMGTEGGGGGAGGRGGGGGGLGAGAGGRGDALAISLPPAPKRSRARPARLIYPAREREVADGELFVARVTVDDHGYVVGAHLTRRLGSPRDDDAAGLIFKFRYEPALDDDGRPIRSTFDQPFAVGH